MKAFVIWILAQLGMARLLLWGVLRLGGTVSDTLIIDLLVVVGVICVTETIVSGIVIYPFVERASRG